jgi:integrase
MKLPAYVHLSRHNVYVFRRRIPSCLLNYFNTNELRLSLATKCIKDATARARILARDSDILFYSLEHNMPIDDKTPFKQLIENKKKELYLQEKIEQLEGMLVESSGMRINQSKQHNENLNIINRRHDEDIDNIKKFMVKAFKVSSDPIKKGPCISELLNDFLSEEDIKRRADKPATVRKDKDALRMFIEIVGDKRIQDVKQSDAKLFSKSILSHKLDGKTRAVNTVNNYMNSVSKFSGWITAHHSEYEHDKLDFSKLRYSKSKLAREEREMFELFEIKKIFSHEKFKKAKTRDPEKYWLIYVALFTGMRLEEIAQLNPQTDIYTDESGLLIFDLNENDGKSLKNKQSIRKVPIHNRLIELGFLEYVESIKKDANRLFPDSKIRDGRKGKNVAKRANYLIQVSVGIKGKSLHSFRHTFTTMLKRALIEESIAAAILGHAHGGITFSRYGKNFLTELLHDEMHKHINFDV